MPRIHKRLGTRVRLTELEAPAKRYNPPVWHNRAKCPCMAPVSWALAWHGLSSPSSRSSRRSRVGRHPYTSCCRQHRMNRSPSEEGKAGQDNEQPPEDQDTHACNIPRSLPPFKVPSAAATGFLLSAVSTGVATQSVSGCVSAIIIPSLAARGGPTSLRINTLLQSLREAPAKLATKRPPPTVWKRFGRGRPATPSST